MFSSKKIKKITKEEDVSALLKKSLNSIHEKKMCNVKGAGLWIKCDDMGWLTGIACAITIYNSIMDYKCQIWLNKDISWVIGPDYKYSSGGSQY